jgi:hypothetical protein
MRDIALPFDNIISRFDGIIDCIKNDFKSFLPEKINRENVYVGTHHHEADKNGNRYLYRGKYFGFTHHNLMQKNVIDKFNERIRRFINLLENTKEEILFVRTAMDDDEINLADEFIISTQKRFPNLKFNIALIYDNKNIEEKNWNYNNKFILSNSLFKNNDQNAKTNGQAFRTFFEFVRKINNLDELFDNLNLFPDDLILKNDKYTGWAIKEGIYPYLDNFLET